MVISEETWLQAQKIQFNSTKSWFEEISAWNIIFFYYPKAKISTKWLWAFLLKGVWIGLGRPRRPFRSDYQSDFSFTLEIFLKVSLKVTQNELQRSTSTIAPLINIINFLLSSENKHLLFRETFYIHHDEYLTSFSYWVQICPRPHLFYGHKKKANYMLNLELKSNKQPYKL